MKKVFLGFFLILGVSFASKAQTVTLNVHLADVQSVVVDPASTGMNQVDLYFTTISDYNNGVKSDGSASGSNTQTNTTTNYSLEVGSTKGFQVSAYASQDLTSTTGTTTIPVSNIELIPSGGTDASNTSIQMQNINLAAGSANAKKIIYSSDPTLKNDFYIEYFAQNTSHDFNNNKGTGEYTTTIYYTISSN